MMKKAVVRLAIVFVAFEVVFVLAKLLFMAVYHDLYSGIGLGGIFDVIRHGLPLDNSMSGYLCIVPALLSILDLCVRSKASTVISRIYFGITALLLSAVFVCDTALYGYWDFKLDTTPIFYFISSPASALASASAAMISAGLAAWIVLSLLIFLLFNYIWTKPGVIPEAAGKKRATGVSVLVLLTAALFIPIRGGLTVSTMNLSHAYFSQNQRYNHAAINPAFSLLYSATHQSRFDDLYRYVEPAEADRLMAGMTYTAFSGDSTLLRTGRPDIWLIIAESFSSHLMPSLGGDSVAGRLDSIAGNGLLFTRFYASSFRTDRALPAILSGFPGQPNTSVMKYVEKAEQLPSLPRRLKDAGYDIAYYYGGDVNFTNMLAYLVNSGFERIVRDKDFSLSERASKWGAHDHTLFNRVIADDRADTIAAPRFRVIQTSSSHEPFEVPFKSRFTDKRLNAFAYSDSCIAAFADYLRTSPRYDRTLVVIVPDHFAVYPDGLTDPQARHAVPLIMTGGALLRHGTVDVAGGQTDLAATLLDACGLRHDEFTYSKNLLDSLAPHYAFYSSPEAIGMVNATDTVAYNLEADTPLYLKGSDADSLLLNAKTYLQKIYDNLSNL